MTTSRSKGLTTTNESAFDRLASRKLEVRGRLRREQAKMKYCIDELTSDYRGERAGSWLRLGNLRRTGTLIGGAIYGVKLLRILLKLRRKLS